MIYYAFILFLMLLSLSSLNSNKKNSSYIVCFLFLLILISVFIGIRHDVGADWGSYLNYNKRMDNIGFIEALQFKDPGYHFFNYISYHLGLGVYGVNFVCALIFSYGLLKYSYTLYRPITAILCAFPYLIVVVSMGYTRQSVALGFFLLAISNRSVFKALVFCVLAALFHKSVAVLVPLIIISRTTNKLTILFWAMATSLILFLYTKTSSFNDVSYIYLEREYNSSGALIRVTMTLIPALIYIYYISEFKSNVEGYNSLPFYMSCAAIIAFGALFIFDSSTTLIDRLALYILPLQMYVFSNLSGIVSKRFSQQVLYLYLISFYHVLVLFVWLNYASNAQAWLPYKTVFNTI